MNQLVTTLTRTDSEEIRFEIREWKGRDFLDIRVYSRLGQGEEKFPTGKGVSIPLTEFQAFKEALTDAEKILKEGRRPE